MYIYGDESGHTGKAIFDPPPFYFQGAILSAVDTEPLLRPIADRYIQALGVERLHANELRQPIVEEIALVFSETLDEINWVFHVTGIEKEYLAITKFVDSIFDSSENKGARWLWYNHDYFRHTLCCFLDALLPTQTKRAFWDAYLTDNYEGISAVVSYALNLLTNVDEDKRLKEVVRDGLTFALENPQEITLMAGQTKKSYKGHTPNMVAFISLLQAVHRFCKERGVVPEVFVHDPQCEFGQVMGEYHALHSHVRTNDHKLGFPQDPERVEYDLGQFSLRPSKEVASLQAVDLFLWLNQRAESIADDTLRKTLMDRTDPFCISRHTSEMIVSTWGLHLSQTALTKEQMTKARGIVEETERGYLQRLEEFRRNKAKESDAGDVRGSS